MNNEIYTQDAVLFFKLMKNRVYVFHIVIHTCGIVHIIDITMYLCALNKESFLYTISYGSSLKPCIYQQQRAYTYYDRKLGFALHINEKLYLWKI